MPKTKRSKVRRTRVKELVKRAIAESLNEARTALTLEEITDKVAEKVARGRSTTTKCLSEMIGANEVQELSEKPLRYALKEGGKKWLL